MWRYRALFSQMRKMLALKSQLDLHTRHPILSPTATSTALLTSRATTFSSPSRYHSFFHSPFWLLVTSPSHSPEYVTASSMVLVWIISFRSINSIICWDAWSPQPQLPPLPFRRALHSFFLPPAPMAAGESSYTFPSQASQPSPSHQVLLFPEIPLPGTYSRSFVASRTSMTSVKLGYYKMCCDW